MDREKARKALQNERNRLLVLCRWFYAAIFAPLWGKDSAWGLPPAAVFLRG
jgi:diphthamide synthase (EF-2-diphthine--ammonia ligase)